MHGVSCEESLARRRSLLQGVSGKARSLSQGVSCEEEESLARRMSLSLGVSCEESLVRSLLHKSLARSLL